MIQCKKSLMRLAERKITTRKGVSGIFCNEMYQPGCTGNFWVAEGTSQPALHKKRACTQVLILYTNILGEDIGDSRKSNNPNALTVPNEKPTYWVQVLLSHWLGRIFVLFSPVSTQAPLNLVVFIFKDNFEIFSLWILMFWILELQLKPKVVELWIGISLIDN